jgi:Flp pilus assembly protein TadD
MSHRSPEIEQYVQTARRLHQQGRLAEAEHGYRQVLGIVPDHPEALHGIGVLALQAGQPAAALAWLDQAIAASPATARFHLHRAHALLGLGQAEAAIEACRTALRFRRNDAETLQTLGHALSDAGRVDEALTAYRDAAKRKPDLPDIQNNLGTALRALNRLDEAESRLREALRRSPRDPGVLVNLSGVLKEQGRFAPAESCLRDALRLRPDDPAATYNLGLLLLLTGRFAEAWPAFEARFAAGAVAARTFRQPAWRGEPLAGRRLLVFAEQGLGDMIQFARFLPALGGSVVFEVPGRMIRLLSSLPGAPPMVAAGDTPPPCDLVCPMMSLPLRLGAPPESWSAAVPYLAAEPERVARWRTRLGESGFKVGVSWQGNPSRIEDKGRSAPLSLFAPLADIPGVRLISLQRGVGSEQIGALPAVEDLGPGLDDGPDAFLDTAAVMANLDLVISTDTAVPHLAGALGRPVWLALRHVPDWRWMTVGDTGPWYPSMRLFRQPRRDDWAPVFAAMAAALARRLAGRID